MNTVCRLKAKGLTVALAVLAVLANACAPFSVVSAASDESLVPFFTSPEDDAALAHANDMVIVVMFEYEDCSWCEYILEHELEPTVRSRAFEATVLFRRAYISDNSPIPSFDGSTTSSAQLANEFGISISPTLVFLGANGETLAPELVGVSSRDFYGYYLEKRINQALSQ